VTPKEEAALRITLAEACEAAKDALEPFKARGIGYVVIVGAGGLRTQNTIIGTCIPTEALPSLLHNAAESAARGDAVEYS
jgi:hypothetical protein